MGCELVREARINCMLEAPRVIHCIGVVFTIVHGLGSVLISLITNRASSEADRTRSLRTIRGPSREYDC